MSWTTFYHHIHLICIQEQIITSLWLFYFHNHRFAKSSNNNNNNNYNFNLTGYSTSIITSASDYSTSIITSRDSKFTMRVASIISVLALGLRIVARVAIPSVDPTVTGLNVSESNIEVTTPAKSIVYKGKTYNYRESIEDIVVEDPTFEDNQTLSARSGIPWADYGCYGTTMSSWELNRAMIQFMVWAGSNRVPAKGWHGEVWNHTAVWVCNCQMWYDHPVPDWELEDAQQIISRGCGDEAAGWLWSKQWQKAYNYGSSVDYMPRGLDHWKNKGPLCPKNCYGAEPRGSTGFGHQ
ncbi:hypothetical protein F5Y15DRAFT_374650 [Xylariaceae sp. FL0016]|nr:hypothetical protein F5Y15DRAFT_374650 [Xylariaceae sp. FL0016]